MEESCKLVLNGRIEERKSWISGSVSAKSDRSEAWRGRGEDQLLDFIEVESAVQVLIILGDEVNCILVGAEDSILRAEGDHIIGLDLAFGVSVDSSEGFEGLEE